MASRKQSYVSPERYLEIQRTAEFPSEYIDGEMVAMSGSSWAHGQIVLNLGSELRPLLRTRPCGTSTGVSVAAPSSYLIPDLVLYCGEADFASGQQILRNPIVIFEILSDSTGSYDRGRKWMKYQRIDSLMHYVLISQDEPNIEVYTRQSDGIWTYEDLAGLDAILSLTHIGVEVGVAGIYDRITFVEPSPE